MRYILEIVTNTTQQKPAAKFIGTTPFPTFQREDFLRQGKTIVATLHSIVPDKDKEDGFASAATRISINALRVNA